MKVKCLSCALVAGLALSAVASAEPGSKQAGGLVLQQAAIPLESTNVSPKVGKVRHGKYYVSTGRIEMADEAPAGAPAVRGPATPVDIWNATDWYGFYNGLTGAGAGGSPAAELVDWGKLCGDPLTDTHEIQSFTFGYGTGSGSTGDLTVIVYWDFNPACTPGPLGNLAGRNCLAQQAEGFNFVGLPGDTTPGDGFIDILFFDAILAPDPLFPVDPVTNPDNRFTMPAGDFGYGYSGWTSWLATPAVTGGLLVNENQILAPGTEDLIDLYTSAPQTGFIFSGNFPNYSQLSFALQALVECAPVELGACCVTPDGLGCQVLSEADCITAGGTFSAIGQACTANFCVPAPANDDCLNATALPSAFDTFVPYDNAGATEDGPLDCDTAFGHNGVDNDVWFTWEAPCSGTARIETCGLTGTDDKLVVYQGTNCGDLNTVVACDDDGCTGAAPFESAAEFAITQGTSYLIRIGNFLGEPGQDGFSGFSLTAVGECTSGPAFCTADWCQDNNKAVSDIFCFLADWFALVPEARTFGGAVTPVPAIFNFLAVWFATDPNDCLP